MSVRGICVCTAADAIEWWCETSRQLSPILEQHAATERERSRRTRVTLLVCADVQKLTRTTCEVYTDRQTDRQRHTQRHIHTHTDTTKRDRQTEIHTHTQTRQRLVGQGLTSHSTQFRSFSKTMFLQVRWPNQQCQSTEGGWLLVSYPDSSQSHHATIIQHAYTYKTHKET